MSTGSVPSEPLNDIPASLENKPEWAERYEFVCDIKTGGQGRVVQAIDLANSKLVAIKEATSPESAHRQRREIEFQMAANHDHVMPVLDAGDGWYVMPFADQSLADAQGTLTDIECATVLLHAARGLLVAHRAGLVHRDISPGNILRIESRWLVSDFGFVSKPRGQSSVERTQRNFGTPGFVAPEVHAIGSHHVDNRADIFSLGAVLRFLLSGSPQGDVSAPWAKLLGPMTAENREERPSTLEGIESQVNQLIRDIRSHLKTAWLAKMGTTREPELSPHAVQVLARIYSDSHQEFYRHTIFDNANKVLRLRLNLGWDELVHRGFIEEKTHPRENTDYWAVTPAGSTWATQHASELESLAQADESRPPPQLPPADDIPF